jgi:hypothetical protein
MWCWTSHARKIFVVKNVLERMCWTLGINNSILLAHTDYRPERAVAENRLHGSHTKGSSRCCTTSLKMRWLLVPALALPLLIPYVSADCCSPVCQAWNPVGPICYDWQCDDGTRGTPYCGQGPCNIFGCNCDGGIDQISLLSLRFTD